MNELYFIIGGSGLCLCILFIGNFINYKKELKEKSIYNMWIERQGDEYKRKHGLDL